MIRYEKIDVIMAAELQCLLSGVQLMEYSAEEKESGCRLLENCLKEIKEEFPILIPAINIFKLFPVKLPIKISTDFSRLFFNPKLVMDEGYLSKEEIKYEVLHIIIHGILGDNEFVKIERKSKLLWLTLDQRVNDICLKLGVLPKKSAVAGVTEHMKQNKPYSPSFGNYYLSKKNPLLKKRASAAWKSIASDDHAFWYPAYLKMMFGLDDGDGEGDGNEEENENGKGDGDGNGAGGTGRKDPWEDLRNMFSDGDGNDKKKADGKSIENKMKGNSGKQRGHGAGNGWNQITEAEGRPIDYKVLLREILRQLEDPREIPDSIDPMMYQFGLDTYGDVPLIEPKEGEEILKLNTLCVAIDTSGSCGGEVAQRFLREVKGLLRELKESLSAGKLLLMQCDYIIQKETTYEIDEFLDEDSEEISEFYGWGGTDFVPVFDRLNELENNDEGKVDALIYLSDGYGGFPEKEPDYPAIFVIPKEDAENEWLPKWVKIGVVED